MIWFRNALKSFLDIRRNAFDVLCVCVALLCTPPCHALDQYTDNCASLTNWLDGCNYGNYAQVNWEGDQSFKLSVTTAATGYYGGTRRQIPVSGNVVSITATVDCDNIGTYSANNRFSIYYYAGQYVHSLSLASDGAFIAGTEIGSDVVDVGVKTKWRVVFVGVNTATCTAALYKNDIFVGSIANAASASTTYTHYLQFTQFGYTLNNAVSYVGSASVESWGLNYRANDTTLNGWTDGDSGNGVSSQISGAMNFTVSSAASGATALRTKTITTAMPNRVILEAKVKHNTLGLRADNNHFAFLLRRKDTQFVGIYFDSSGLYRRTGASTYTEIGTDIVTTGTADTWRFFIDFDADKIYVWKNGVFQAGGLACVYTTTGLTAITSITQLGYTVKGDTDVYYANLFSEDGTLLQTVIE
jgi:hypothetical protein